MTRFEFILFWNTCVIIAIKVAYMFFIFSSFKKDFVIYLTILPIKKGWPIIG